MTTFGRICSLAALCAVIAVGRGGRAYTLWIEDAESGTANVLTNVSSYPLIQSQIVGQGSNAFHLANPGFQDNWFVVDKTLAIQPDTKLFFLSRLGWASPDQVARVQISTNGGSTWPTNLYNQAGTGNSGEGSFSLKELNLSSYAGQNARFRFYYDFAGSSGYTQTTNDVGWLVDNIQIGSEFQKIPWSIGNPSADAQQYLEYINRARADAMVEANRLANETDSDINDAYNFFGINRPDIVGQFQYYVNSGAIAQNAQPLAFQSQLLQAAELHTQDMYQNQFQGHNSSSNPPAPFQPGYSLVQRLSAVGYSGGAGENVFSNSDSVAYGHAGFDVDWGNLNNSGAPFYNPAFNDQGMQNPAGHRRNLHNPDFKEIGIGVINGTNGSVGPQVVTQDLGNPGSVRYVTGVVYEDLNSNNFYDIGEGRPGVRIDVNGSAYYALSAASGGYAVPVNADGTYNVTFSGGSFATFATTASVIAGRNVKVDYLAQMIAMLLGDYNENGIVDAADYVVWRKKLGSGTALPNDDTPGVGNDDYARWRARFGNTNIPPGSGAGASIAIPEPSTLAMLIAAMGIVTSFKRRETL
jgi:uncharacterized protein YkwD